ncbi:MAG: translesion error-prone DNA polymerase V autoproteolytic subunit [Duncaniella sp.]|nr:translesion error-prone DNA polymerase V autoproteolytic subunit [Bacteroides sp.]MDE6066399.1 translesion error-prone DNA polymerase V autoproteolytic subunit [Duncaniella sp.]
MSGIKIIHGGFDDRLELLFANAIRAGFPSTAEGYANDSLDFNRDMIRHPEATFYGRVYGDSMIDAGIDDGDIAVIDRLAEPANGDIVVAFINDEFTIKYLDTTHRSEGYILLRPANPSFEPIRISMNDNFRVWGVVIWTIKKWKR